MGLFSSPAVIPAKVVDPATVTYVSTAGSASNLTTYTFTSQSFGTAHADRILVCTVGGQGQAAGAKSVSSLTIGGISATLVKAQQGLTLDYFRSEIWRAAVPTGTSGTVVINWNDTMETCISGLFSVITKTAAPYATAGIGGDGATQISTTISSPDNGIILGCHYGNSTPDTWSGLTERYDTHPSTQSGSGASDAFASAQTSKSIGVTPGGGAQHALALASWGP